jgi:hypothetical protein
MTTRAQARPTPQGGYWFAAALMAASDLPQMAAHLGHVLAAMADNETGRVKVSLSELARRSHQARSSVVKHLAVLEAHGFVSRSSPAQWAARQLHEMTVYTCTIPAGFPTKAGPSYGLGAGTSHGLGLVRESQKAGTPHGPRSIDLKGAAPDADAPGPTPTKCPHGHRLALGTCPDPDCVTAAEHGTAS